MTAFMDMNVQTTVAVTVKMECTVTRRMVNVTWDAFLDLLTFSAKIVSKI